jgi:hypothetical protein
VVEAVLAAGAANSSGGASSALSGAIHAVGALLPPDSSAGARSRTST